MAQILAKKVEKTSISWTATIREMKAGQTLYCTLKERLSVASRLEHDSIGNNNEELAQAAALYALPEVFRSYEYDVRNIWPWDFKWWKPTPNDRVRELVKAGALIAAEIDRLTNTK